MTTEILDNGMIKDVVQHMNEDHADACLAIVQAQGKQPEATSAQMISMNTTAVEFSALVADETRTPVRVLFDKPITDSRQVRGHLVSMTKRARDLLG